MIKYLSDDTKYRNVTAKLKDKDVFFTRINVLHKSYGLNCDFLDIWYQSFNENYVSLISRLDNQFILFLTENSNIQENIKEIVSEQHETKSILRSQTNQNSLNNSSVDDLPEIVSFPKRAQKHQPKKVFKNIINNI